MTGLGGTLPTDDPLSDRDNAQHRRLGKGASWGAKGWGGEKDRSDMAVHRAIHKLGKEQ